MIPTTWTVHFIGKPDAVKRALAAYGDGLYGPTQAAYNRAKNVLDQLIDLSSGSQVVSLNASGTVAEDGNNKVSVVLIPSSAMMVQ